jgi:16S rRNA (guanine527-N7)-methyltransferase
LKLRAGAAQFGLSLSDAQLAHFARFRDELLDWNRRLNLTAITHPDDIDRLHFVDSLACLLEPIAEGASVLDVGAGAGFPGVPLKIARPDLQVTLLEATGKKARFLEHAVSVLGLAGVEVIHDRAETAGGRQEYDVVVARALAAMPALLELTLPFCRIGGRVLALKKGTGLPAELASARRALEVLGGELAPPREYELDGEPRQVVVVRKVRPTPAGYPRRPGMPAKKPL